MFSHHRGNYIFNTIFHKYHSTTLNNKRHSLSYTYTVKK